ncbi:uncharacterized protein TNIN_348621 [Trichonephila inaurata madagascariensis]|uniref:Peptidase aspartic putative domain-containing protein n=1 Tax=Trichonephila inaurata madagascariensis TaxID=2747483 RepID=A0A8X7CGS6_9ARAC|nr:uncharacterized protein TNIN_348621 [Trichonephila inaurata madagascariensis]
MVEEYREKSLRIQLRAKRALEHLKRLRRKTRLLLPIMARSYKMIMSRKHYANDSPNLDCEYSCSLDALDQDIICNDITNIGYGSWMRELKRKKIFITDFQNNSRPIEVLLGVDVVGKLFTEKRGQLTSGLVAMGTKLGWTLMGKVPQLQHQNVNMTVVSMLNRNSYEHATILQDELSKLKEESAKTKTTFEQKSSELQKKNKELLSDVKERNIALKEKEEIKICHEKKFQSQKEEFDSELKNEDQKLAEILENNEKFSEVISEENVTSEEKDEMLLDLQSQLKTKETELNLSSQEKKSNQELDDMTENDEELKILHEKKLLLLVITEKELEQKEGETNSLKNMVKEK